MNSQPKWTTSPWTNSNGLVNGIETRPGLGGTSLDIFDAEEWPAALEEEAQANAHLIAAAPELYTAIVELLDELNTSCEDIDGEGYNNPRINALLAKARGE